MVVMKLFVEGGGEQHDQIRRCRIGFSKFIEKAGLAGKMPRVVASGSRNAAFKDYSNELQNTATARQPMLLVDSEGPVSKEPWDHLEERDGWKKPNNAQDDDAQLMVQCMETWLVADRKALRTFFGPELKDKTLPGDTNLEQVPKDEVLKKLTKATKKLPKTPDGYRKGKVSFDLLAQLDPAVVCEKLPHAKRLVEAVRARMEA